MLILSRQKSEAIYIGDIRIVVVENRGGRVYLGIDAPREVPVHREEIYLKIKRKEAEGEEVHGN